MTKGSTKIFGYGALAATAVIASVSVPGCTPTSGRGAETDASQVVEVEEGKIYICQLGEDTVGGLIDDMQSGGGLGTPLTVAYVEVYTLRNNSGQPLPDLDGGDTAPEGPHTGPVICFNDKVSQVPTPVQQTDNIVGGDGTLDLLDLDNTGVRYRLNGGVERRSCHAVGGASECLLFVPKGEGE